MTREHPIVGYVESSLPGETQSARIELARRHGLALEVAHRGSGSLDGFVDCGVPIASVQAFLMHEDHPLHRDPARRELASAHVRATIAEAARLGAPRVITVCGFGHDVCTKPFESCEAFFRALVPDAREHGVRVLIEPLSSQRAGAMTRASEIGRLLAALAAPDVFGTALDTGHILDDGHDVERYLARWKHPVDELQLRGAGSTPPALDAPVRRWLAALRARELSVPHASPSAIVVEHRAPIALDEFERWIERMRSKSATD
jgi:Xylose isomerase-like TIM barrel